MKDYKDKKGCKSCKHNRDRTVNQKECKKGHRAVFGFGCRDYEQYAIGHQFTIFDLMNEEQERS